MKTFMQTGYNGKFTNWFKYTLMILDFIINSRNFTKTQYSDYACLKRWNNWSWSLQNLNQTHSRKKKKNLFHCCINILFLIIANCEGQKVFWLEGQVLQETSKSNALNLDLPLREQKIKLDRKYTCSKLLEWP